MKIDLTQPLATLKALYVEAKKAYYNEKPVLTDAQFDKLEDHLKEVAPTWAGLKKAGAPVQKKTKRSLPVPMFSLDKLRSNNFDKWISVQKDEDFVLMDKMDGSSIEIGYVDGLPNFAITRGNGTIGGDISFMLPHLKIPQKVGTQTFIIRCEALFSKTAYTKWKNELTEEENSEVDLPEAGKARAVGTGMLNRKGTPHKAVRDLTICVLQVLEPNNKVSDGLKWAKKVGFDTVPFVQVKRKDLTVANMEHMLKSRTGKDNKYYADGVVVAIDKKNPLPKSGNPTWAVAYKATEDEANAPRGTVSYIFWDVSSNGVIVPVARFDPPIMIDGTKVKEASAYNAKNAMEKGIGVGAQVAVIKAGEIIPKIIQVYKKGKFVPPDAKVFGEYGWDKNKTNYVLYKPKESTAVRIKIITRFLVKLDIEGIKVSTVTKLYEGGYTNISKLVKSKSFVDAGFTEASSQRIYEAIHSKIDKGVPILKLMIASNVFPMGVGETLLEKIAKAVDIRELMKWSKEQIMEKLLEIPGYQETTAQKVLDGIHKFEKWQALTGILATGAGKIEKKVSVGKLAGVGVTWTSYRNRDEEATVIHNGGEVVSFGGSTNYLIYNPAGKASTKLDKAKAKGIPVLTWKQFTQKVGI